MDLTFKGKCTHCGKIRTYKENFNITTILKQLLNGLHLEKKEVKRAYELLHQMKINLNQRVV